MKKRISLVYIFCMLAIMITGTMSAQESKTVTGKVIDEYGDPIIGAAVRVVDKEQQRGTITNIEGYFTIEANIGDILSFSYVGYDSKEYKIDKRELAIELTPSKESQLEEVVVIGYGAVKKKDLTGSVANVKMSDIKDIPTLSVDNALQGRIAGVDVMSTTGEPGSSASIRIRGTRSITASNEPLIVVDGVMDAVTSLSDINSADIEDISVLKDASSTAIYGSRGSNGVILITTKTGLKGKPRVVFKADAGFSQIPRYLDIMNATEFAQYRNDYASISDSYFPDLTPTSPMSEYPFPDPYRYGEGTNWTKEITRIAPYQNYNLSLSGGTDKTKWFGSFGYNNTQGIIRSSGIQRYTARLRVDHELFNRFKVGVNYSYTYRDQDLNTTAIGGDRPWEGAIYINPLLKKDETYNDIYGTGQTINNPLHYIDLKTNNHKSHTSILSASITYEPIDKLILKSQLSYNMYNRHIYQWESGDLPTKNESEGGTAYRGEYKNKLLSSETTADYSFTLDDDHNFNVLGGWTASTTQNDNFTLQGKGYLAEYNTWNSMGMLPNKNNLTPSTSYQKKVAASALGRLNYNFKQRYYLTVTGRYDKASNFAPNNKGGFFPSAALKWNAKEEEFLSTVNWLDQLSLRLSGGRAGNDGISPYLSDEAYGNSLSGYIFNGQQPLAVYPSRLPSPNLTWEKTDTYNLGLDITLFNSRVNIVAEAYLSKTKDLLLWVDVPTHTGYGSVFQNLGKVTNKGWELTIDSRNIITKDFSWSTTLTFSQNKQRVDDIGSYDVVPTYYSYGNNKTMMYGYKEGYPLNALWGYQYEGIWHTQEEIDRNEKTNTYASGAQAWYKVGYQKYLDANQSGNLDQDDLIYLGNADPWLHGGVQNTFTYKGLSLGVYFMYSLGGKMYNIAEQHLGTGTQTTNQYRYMLDGYHPVRNPESNIPAAGSTDNLVSSRLVHDATFLRLKNVSLSYNFDAKKWTNNIISNIIVTASGENLYLWKKYNGFDPDVSSEGTSSTLRRVDNGAYPKPRTIVFSLQLTY